MSPSDRTTGFDLKKGDKLDVAIPGMGFQPVVVVSKIYFSPNHASSIFSYPTRTMLIIQTNEPLIFSWLGSIPYIISGQHDFKFTPDPTNPNRTLFSQSESFTGLLGFTANLFGGKTSAGWEAVNRDLKKAAEAKWAAEGESK